MAFVEEWPRAGIGGATASRVDGPNFVEVVRSSPMSNRHDVQGGMQGGNGFGEADGGHRNQNQQRFPHVGGGGGAHGGGFGNGRGSGEGGISIEVLDIMETIQITYTSRGMFKRLLRIHHKLLCFLPHKPLR